MSEIGMLRQPSKLAYDERDETPPHTSHGWPIWKAQTSQ